VKPEVVPGEYIGLEVPYRGALVTEDEIEAELKAAAERNARLVPVEDRPSRQGDVLLIDYEGSVDGVPFQGGKADGFSLELGSKSFIEGFEEQLIGKSPDERTEVTVRFPDDYGNESLNGKDAVFKVTVHSIKLKELPGIDDDFAQESSEFDSLEEYKADIRKKLTEKNVEKTKRGFENELVAKIVADSQVDIPGVMIDRQAETSFREFEMTLAYQGLDLERYYQITSSDRGKLEESIRARSADEVKSQLVLERIARDNGIEVSDEEYDADIKRRAEKLEKDYEEYRSQISDDYARYIRSNMKTEKVMSFLTENTKKI
jgi:trigger factor